MKTKIIMENWKRFLKEAKWHNSPDEDWPTAATKVKKYKSDKVIIFDKNDQYGNIGANSHGRDSHMAKHWLEFGDQVKSSIEKTKNIIKRFSQQNKVYQVQRGGASVEIDVTKISDGDIINTYDHINDKNFDGRELLDVEKEIYNNSMMLAVSSYDKEADSVMSQAVDVSDALMKSIENLTNVLQKNNIIKFKAIYRGSVKQYYYDSERAALIAQLDDGSIATLYRLRYNGKNKKENPLSSIRGFNSAGGTKPTDEYSLLRSLADQQKNKAQAANQKQAKPKKQKTQQKKSQSPTELVKALVSRGLSPEKIRDILSKKYPKMPPQGIDGVLKKAGVK